MILTVDVGNTTISFAGFADGELVSLRKISTQRSMGVEAFEETLRARFMAEAEGHSEAAAWSPEDVCGRPAGTGLRALTVEGTMLSSVVPELNPSLTEALRRVTGHQVLTLTPKLDTGISVAGYAAGNLGMDRLADLAGAAELVKPPLVVFDLGTCTTASVLDQNRCFAGGMIAPGVQISLDIMHERAAKLPQLVAEEPGALLGRDTPGCMLSGAVIGAACVIDGYADRAEQKLGAPLSVVVTGGAGEIVIPWCRREVRYEPQLLHRGLYALYQKNVSNF